MYALYNKHLDGNSFRYTFKEKVSLFGCNSGYIPYLLKQKLEQTSSEPLSLHVNIENELNSSMRTHQTLIINLKPNSSKPNPSLYELIDVWGHSASGWTPVMLYLRGLYVDNNPGFFDVKDFTRSLSDVKDPIFSMTYLSGTVKNGSIEGKWTSPGPSPTNSVLLWPTTFKYFAEKAGEIINRTALKRH